jgi:hypothetical protein
LLESAFQKKVERNGQEFLLAAMLFPAGRPPNTRTRDDQIG